MREAEICPRREGVSCVPAGGEARSRLREVDCLRAVLKRVFLKVLAGNGGGGLVRGHSYHDEGCGINAREVDATRLIDNVVCRCWECVGDTFFRLVVHKKSSGTEVRSLA